MSSLPQITLGDKTFELLIGRERIQQMVLELAQQINRDFKGRQVVVVGVLDGAFMVLADLLKKLDISVSLELLKLKSYQGMRSTGQVTRLLGLTSSLKGQHVLIVEDIIDSGLTLQELLKLLRDEAPASITIATLLFKKEVFKGDYDIRYCATEIPNRFVVGYGMDYDGLGRQLPDIYAAVEEGNISSLT